MTKSNTQDTLVQLVRANSEKRNWAESLLRIVRADRNSRGENRNRELVKLEAAIVDKLARDMDDRQMYHHVLEANHEFVVRLKQQHQDLTENELLLSCFFHMELPVETIASLKGISQASLKMARSRLKNKLGMDDGLNLDEYLQQF